jgi:uncharacterized membrane protein
MYPLLATTAKMKDRMSPDAPRTLDGQRFMQSAIYFDQGGEMDLGLDYAGIRWVQEQVQGSPVILEGNTPEYRWGSRYTIYTGLPGVVGWNWHQRQQRGGVAPADWVTDRIGEINLFYTSPDVDQALNILRKYQVRYFVLGQLERNYYPGPGLDKFAAAEGIYWQAVFQNEGTIIYQVLDNPPLAHSD